MAVQVEHEIKLRVPIHTLDGIVCFGRVSCSPPLLHLCAERNVTISFLSERGRFWARIQGPVSGNVLLRREQYRRADELQSSALIARVVVVGKLLNERTTLQRAVRDHLENPNIVELQQAIRVIGNIVERLEKTEMLAQIRGCEGEGSRVYFGVFNHLILTQKEDFFFRDRNRRPPLDNINALLSFLYTLLTHDTVSALEGVGLDPSVGFLHRDRPGRPSLALDLMEELRPMLADRLALSLVNRRQVNGKGFRRTETGAVEMNEDTLKTVIVAYQERKREGIRHPFLNESIKVGLLPHAQALLLARHLRGDLEAYPPFIWK